MKEIKKTNLETVDQDYKTTVEFRVEDSSGSFRYNIDINGDKTHSGPIYIKNSSKFLLANNIGSGDRIIPLIVFSTSELDGWDITPWDIIRWDYDSTDAETFDTITANKSIWINGEHITYSTINNSMVDSTDLSSYFNGVIVNLVLLNDAVRGAENTLAQFHSQFDIVEGHIIVASNDNLIRPSGDLLDVLSLFRNETVDKLKAFGAKVNILIQTQNP